MDDGRDRTERQELHFFYPPSLQNYLSISVFALFIPGMFRFVIIQKDHFEAGGPYCFKLSFKLAKWS